MRMRNGESLVDGGHVRIGGRIKTSVTLVPIKVVRGRGLPTEEVVRRRKRRLSLRKKSSRGKGSRSARIPKL